MLKLAEVSTKEICGNCSNLEGFPNDTGPGSSGGNCGACSSPEAHKKFKIPISISITANKTHCQGKYWNPRFRQ